MNTTRNDVTTWGSALSLLTGFRDERRERRRALAAHRVLEQELATFTMPADVSELRAAADRHDSAEAEQIRSILTNNVSDYHRRRRLTA
jgi:hypothetical protein